VRAAGHTTRSVVRLSEPASVAITNARKQPNSEHSMTDSQDEKWDNGYCSCRTVKRTDELRILYSILVPQPVNYKTGKMRALQLRADSNIEAKFATRAGSIWGSGRLPLSDSQQSRPTLLRRYKKWDESAQIRPRSILLL
jgi:hypothetical protein